MFEYGHIWVPTFVSYPDNNFDSTSTGTNPFVPEMWAQEALMVLEANMVAANLVYRDYSNQIAQFGDTVNARRPGTFNAKRKVDGDTVTVQAATATNVPVVLNQHLHTSFMIKDGEESKGFQNLVREFLTPAVLSIAQSMDQIVLTQCYQFLPYSAGKLGTTPTVQTVIDTGTVMNNNKAPMSGRNLILTPNTQGYLMGIDAFHEADKVGDAGTAMREASLGRKFGFNTFMCQNAPSINGSATYNTVTTSTIAADAAAGATGITMTGGHGYVAGSWMTIAGDMTPQRITNVSTNALTIEPGLKYAVSSGAATRNWTMGAIDQASSPTGYAINWSKDMVLKTFASGKGPKSGQLVSIGATAGVAYYGAIGTSNTHVLMTLDRPLAAAAADSAVVGVGPSGEYNFAFHENAIALVTRPLSMPMAGTGALAYVASYNGLSIRVVITYDGEMQGHLVTVDTLCGIKVLDQTLGCIVYA